MTPPGTVAEVVEPVGPVLGLAPEGPEGAQTPPPEAVGRLVGHEGHDRGQVVAPAPPEVHVAAPQDGPRVEEEGPSEAKTLEVQGSAPDPVEGREERPKPEVRRQEEATDQP